MTVVSFRRRLEALEGLAESKVGPPQRSPLSTLMQGLIAYHLGQVGEAVPNESIAEGMARGLGYEKGRDLMDGLRAGTRTPRRDDLNARWRDAIGRLFALKGAVPNCDGPTFAETLHGLFFDMPERLRRHPYLTECGAVFAEVVAEQAAT